MPHINTVLLLLLLLFKVLKHVLLKLLKIKKKFYLFCSLHNTLYNRTCNNTVSQYCKKTCKIKTTVLVLANPIQRHPFLTMN